MDKYGQSVPEGHQSNLLTSIIEQITSGSEDLYNSSLKSSKNYSMMISVVKFIGNDHKSNSIVKEEEEKKRNCYYIFKTPATYI